MSLLLAQAAVNDANIHFDKLYSYRIPAELAGKMCIRDRISPASAQGSVSSRSV